MKADFEKYVAGIKSKPKALVSEELCQALAQDFFFEKYVTGIKSKSKPPVSEEICQALAQEFLSEQTKKAQERHKDMFHAGVRLFRIFEFLKRICSHS